MVVIMRLDIQGCRHMICRIASRLLRICLMMNHAAIIMVVGVVLRTITGEVVRVEGLGLGMISMTSITVNVVYGFGFFFGYYSMSRSFPPLFSCLSISTLVLILIPFKLGVAWIRRYPFFPGLCMTDDISYFMINVLFCSKYRYNNSITSIIMKKKKCSAYSS